MPIYAYRCSSCGIQKDHLQKISDPVMTVCPECGKPTYKKMLTAAGFQLKGSGWYATDFKGGSSPSGDSKTKEGGSGESKDGGSKDAGSKESAPKESASKEGASKDSSSSSGSSDSGPSASAASGS